MAEGEATMGTEYTYGWNSFTCPNHIFRIEAELGVTDQTYYFSIDGQNFNQFPREAVNIPAASTSNGHSTASRSPTGNKKTQVVSKSNAAPRGVFQSPGDEWGNNDPFTSSDPFGDSKPPSVSKTPVASDPFGDSMPSDKPSGGSSFDFFGDNMSTPVAKPVTTNNNVNSRTSAAGGSSAQSGNKFTSSVPTATVTPVQVTSKPAFDLLNDDVPVRSMNAGNKGNYLDDFAQLSLSTSTSSAGGGHSSGGVHASPAKDVFDRLNDPFAPKAVIVPTTTNQQSPIINNMNNTHTTNTTKKEFDILDSGLVSLDLNPTKPGQAKTRKEEYEKNLPLNTLMGGSNTSRTPVMTSEPVAQPPPMRVMSSAESISALGGPLPPRPVMMGGPMSYGGQPQPFGGPQMMNPYGAPSPYGFPPQQQQLPMMGGNPYGGTGGGPMLNNNPPRPIGGGNGMAQYGSYGQQSKNTTTPTKSNNPLDSLDWKM